jgi:nitroimidazol reductase NimA-like FMN-containing flavoprotein (pyridoxamine 5'-phosphate oxidase superfamily)
MTAQLQELSHAECLWLLAQGRVGRLAFCSPAGQQVVVVNYRLSGQAIVCRTTAYSELGQHGRDADVAFEIDGLDHDQQTGWSVLAKGRLQMVCDRAELAAIKADADPVPWAAGARCLYLKLAWRELTGRRIQHLSANLSRRP